jgi:hypothetical protein
MKDTCAYCYKHTWDDVNHYHICLLADVPGEIPLDTDPCERFRPSQRGYVGCTDPEHEHIIDYDQICGHVKDDKYTRRK